MDRFTPEEEQRFADIMRRVDEAIEADDRPALHAIAAEAGAFQKEIGRRVYSQMIGKYLYKKEKELAELRRMFGGTP
jgi:hypothetical protein